MSPLRSWLGKCSRRAVAFGPLLALWLPMPVLAQGVVPGTGTLQQAACDDFEDEAWTYTYNLPKASSNIDKQVRAPAGFASNMKWDESTYRGTPDFVKRVETPEGGIKGSKGAMAIQTLNSGIPGSLSYKFEQDDLIARINHTLGYLPVSRTPQFVTRVYLPPFDQWEKRTGSHFGFRTDAQTILDKPTSMGRFFRGGGTTRQVEAYWPGMFIQFNSKHDRPGTEDSAMILIRSGSRGEDIPGPVIKEPGWWTLGMTYTPDGQVHYYAHKGVEPLTARDHLYSAFPYGYKATQVNTFFYNIVNQYDGKTWSTRFIVDDPQIYTLN